MNLSTSCCLPAPIALHRPWWRRAWDALRQAAGRPAPADADERRLYRSLSHLSEETLRDIGAPSWLHERDRGADLRRLDRAMW